MRFYCQQAHRRREVVFHRVLFRLGNRWILLRQPGCPRNVVTAMTPFEPLRARRFIVVRGSTASSTLITCTPTPSCARRLRKAEEGRCQAFQLPVSMGVSLDPDLPHVPHTERLATPRHTTTISGWCFWPPAPSCTDSRLSTYRRQLLDSRFPQDRIARLRAPCTARDSPRSSSRHCCSCLNYSA